MEWDDCFAAAAEVKEQWYGACAHMAPDHFQISG